MSDKPNNIEEIKDKSFFSLQFLYNTLLVTFVMFAFLTSLSMMGGAFKLFGKEIAQEIINITANPFIGLFIGIFVTAVVQSSSTTTSMIVAMVASGVLTIPNAVPMIMGANIGTSVTSSFVSLGFMGTKKEFRKAISAATIHDFFNILVVICIFPLEYFFGFLTSISGYLAGMFSSDIQGPEMFSILKVTVKPTAKALIAMTGKNVWIALPLALIMLLISLNFLTKILKKLLIGKAEKKLDKIIFSKPYKALGWGALLTAAVQSSSVTTSLIVPMVAVNKISLRKAFPFLMGANIGTTITALIAAMSIVGPSKEAALTIALAHLLFNVFGVVILFPLKVIRDIPIKLSRKLGRATLKNKLVGVGYIFVTFFLVPFILIFFSSSKTKLVEYSMQEENLKTEEVVYAALVDIVDESGLIKREEYLALDSIDAERLNPDRKININRLQDVVFMGKTRIELLKKGFCWDSEDLSGKYNMCVEEIQSNVKILDAYKADSIYVYRKKYYDDVDSTYQMIYFNPTDKIITKTQLFDKNDNIIKENKLIEVL